MPDVIRRIFQPFGDVSSLTRDEIREFVHYLEKLALDVGEAVEVPMAHHFSKDVYAREMKLPKGAMVVGKIHAHENMNILSEGEASVLSVDGMIRVKAPYTFVGSPGAKRVIFAHTDLTWTTIHGTASRDLEEIEKQMIAPTYADVKYLENQEVSKCLG